MFEFPLGSVILTVSGNLLPSKYSVTKDKNFSSFS